MNELQIDCADDNVTRNAKRCAKLLAELRAAKQQSKKAKCIGQMRDYEASLDLALGMHLQDCEPVPRLN
jgi:hypothetical protein